MQQPSATDSLVIAGRFRGPPRSGNGGYVAGLLASRLPPGPTDTIADAIEVTLRAPAPLDTALQLEHQSDRTLLAHGEVLVAEARHVRLDLSIPEPPSWDEACAVRDAGQRGQVPGMEGRYHPLCFCCALGLAEDAGLGVQCYAVADRSLVAGPFICNPVFAAADGVVPASIVWTALDCPGHAAWRAVGARSGALLGRMTARVVAPLHAGERSVIIGWKLQSEGRKLDSGTALFGEGGQLCAYAKATWIARAAP